MKYTILYYIIFFFFLLVKEKEEKRNVSCKVIWFYISWYKKFLRSKFKALKKHIHLRNTR